MPSGYRTIEGTDLDDIFYVDNGGSGALGYVGANSTSDLGDRYTSVTTLGTSVGYKAASGEDIGYLRGDKAEVKLADGSGLSVQKFIAQNDRYCSACSFDGEGPVIDSVNCGAWSGVVTINSIVTTVLPGMTWEVRVCHVHKEGGYTHRTNFGFWNDSSDHINDVDEICPAECDRFLIFTNCQANKEYGTTNLPTLSAQTNNTRKFSYAFKGNDGKNGKAYSMFVRVYQRFVSSAYTLGWFSTDISVS